MKKILSILLVCLVIVTGAMTAYAATTASDYTTLKYGKVEDAGNNTVRIYGKGVMGTTVKQGTSFASAVIYNNPVDAKNVSFDLEFVKDYGNGEGRQSGWYAFNISKTPAWFSSVKSVIKAEEISGVNVIFKLDTANKKKVFLEISRYSPGSGFTYIFGGTIEADINEDWKCHVDITNGVLYIDGKEILDLSDALSLALGGSNSGYLGFGGFSENNYDIEMKVNFEGTQKTGTTDTETTDSEKDNTENNKPATETTTGTEVTDSENVTTEATESETTESETTESETTESETTESETAESEITESETPDTEGPKDDTPADAQPDTLVIVLVIILIAAVLACGGIGVMIIKKKKG